VIIVSLEKTVGKSSDTAQAIVLLILYAAITAQSIKWPSFNYARVSMWSTLSFIGVFWLVFINILSWNVSNSLAWIILLFFGWAIILITGFLLQKLKFPSMLTSEKHPNLPALFKFAFQCGLDQNEISKMQRSIFRSQSIYSPAGPDELSSEQMSSDLLFPSYSDDR
jgi:hypothetical protein